MGTSSVTSSHDQLKLALHHLRVYAKTASHDDAILARAAITLLTETPTARTVEPDLAGVA